MGWLKDTKKLTDRGAAVRHTKIEVLETEGNVIPQLPSEQEQELRGISTSSIRASPGQRYSLRIGNSETHIAVNVKVDGEGAIMPNWARRPDGSKIFRKPPRLPVWRGKPLILTGYQSAKERDEVEFRTEIREFKFDNVEYMYRAEDFPDLAGAGGARRLLRGDTNPEAADPDEDEDEDEDEEEERQIFGGWITVQVFELEQKVIKGRSQEGGNFAERREIEVAQRGDGSVRTVPGAASELISMVGSRESDLKEERGRHIFTQKIFYGGKGAPATLDTTSAWKEMKEAKKEFYTKKVAATSRLPARRAGYQRATTVEGWARPRSAAMRRAYWTCRCGGWTWADAPPSCFRCGLHPPPDVEAWLFRGPASSSSATQATSATSA